MKEPIAPLLHELFLFPALQQPHPELPRLVRYPLGNEPLAVCVFLEPDEMVKHSVDCHCSLLLGAGNLKLKAW